MKKPEKFESILLQTFIEANRIREKAVDDGASKADAIAIITNALRAAWPKGRNEPWKYICDVCDDTGWRFYQCPGDATCGRTKKVHAPHDYVEPCWCARGQSLKPKPPSEPDILGGLGKQKKSKGFSRFGR